MLTSNHKTRTLSRSSYAGFTALELLVVMAIIAFLAVIVLFSVSAIRQRAIQSNDTSLVMSISQACEGYALDHDGMYPGQSRIYFDRMKKNPSQTHSSMTGSQVMVAELMGYSVAADGLWQESSSIKKYINFKPLQLDLPRGADGAIDDTLNISGDSGYTITGFRHSLMDSYPIDPMPILYFPARPGRKGSGPDGSFVFEDNSRSSASYPSGSDENTFYGFITKSDDEIVHEMYNSGRFIVIAAGKDREYFTEDDIVNFARK